MTLIIEQQANALMFITVLDDLPHTHSASPKITLVNNQKAVFWVVIIVLSVILMLVLWILMVPLMIDLDSESRTLRLGHTFLFSMIIAVEDRIRVTIRILGFQLKTEGRKKPEKKNEKKRKKRKSPVPGRTFLKEIWRSMIIRKLHMDIDTDDFVLNARLVPLAYFLTNREWNRYFNINFQGRVLIQLIAEIRLYMILRAFIKNLLKR